MKPAKMALPGWPVNCAKIVRASASDAGASSGLR
jgi:hypothetical protein